MIVLIRALALLLLGAAILGIMALYVWLTQPGGAPDQRLTVEPEREIVWWWQQAAFDVRFNPSAASDTSTARPSDILFLLDTSGSMSGDDLDAARRALLELPDNLDADQASVALIEFADRARVVAPLTRDHNSFAETVWGMDRRVGSGTQFLAGLNEALQLLRGRPPATVVLLTDGNAGESDSALRDFYESRWRPSAHELFLLGIGASGVNPKSFLELTDDPSTYIITGLDKRAVDTLFVEAAKRLGNVMGRNADLELPLAQPLWSWFNGAPPERDSAFRTLPRFASYPATLNQSILFKREYRWRGFVDPRLGGILPLFSEPVRLSYLDDAGARQHYLSAPQSAKVLVITPWLLILLALPFLLYVLAKLLEWWLRPTVTPLALSRPPRVRPREAIAALPMRVPDAGGRICWAPALVIGLGKTGRGVVTHLKQALEDSFDLAESRPQLLALDLARSEIDGERSESFDGCLEPLGREQLFMLPASSCDLNQLPTAGFPKEDPRAQIVLGGEFRGESSEYKRLHRGTRGEAALARMALLNDLAHGDGSALLNRLRGAIEGWSALSADKGDRQIVIVAHASGGVGRGWLVDLLILLRRLVVEEERIGRAVELSILLLGSSGQTRWQTPDGRSVAGLDAADLLDELDRLASAGRHPFEHPLACPTGDPAIDQLLQGWVERRPQDAIYTLPVDDPNANGGLAEGADILSLLLDPARRNELVQLFDATRAQEESLRAARGIELYREIRVQQAAAPRAYLDRLIQTRLLHLIGSKGGLFPDLLEEQGQRTLESRPAELSKLLDLDPLTLSAEPGVLKALIDELIGERGASLKSLPPENEDLVQAAHDLRRLIAENGNRLLRDRSIGLGGLRAALESIRQKLADHNHPPLIALVADLSGLIEEIDEWVALFLGEAVRRVLTNTPQAAAQKQSGSADQDHGVLDRQADHYHAVLAQLHHWQSIPSRTLIGPLAGLRKDEPFDEGSANTLFRKFLSVWLKAEKGAEAALRARCFWEIAMPARSTRALGVELVLYGMSSGRFAPAASEIERLQAQLEREVIDVIDASEDFHALGLIADRLDDLSDEAFDAAIVRFVAAMKGALKGERAGLILSLPQLGAGANERLQRLYRQINARFAETAGAAELLSSHDARDRYRVTLLQLLPLLIAPTRTAPPAHPIHAPERRRVDYGAQLAQWRDLTEVELPLASGIALADQERLRGFALSYGSGLVTRSELDELWYLRARSGWVALTYLPEQGLVDAAARFVSTSGLEPMAAESDSPPSLPSVEGEESFVDLLEWLINEPQTLR